MVDSFPRTILGVISPHVLQVLGTKGRRRKLGWGESVPQRNAERGTNSFFHFPAEWLVAFTPHGGESRRSGKAVIASSCDIQSEPALRPAARKVHGQSANQNNVLV